MEGVKPHLVKKDNEAYYEHQNLGPGLESVESARAAAACLKNPGHKTFLPVHKLKKRHLPKPYRGDKEFFEMIKNAVDLTVRLRVSATSSGRPAEGHFGTKGGTRTGTGYVWSVWPSDRWNPCQGSKCAGKHKGDCNTWTLNVVTAQHVVFDDEEAKMTMVDLFYDNEKSRKNSDIKTIRGGKLFVSNEVADWCVISFETCDAELANKLNIITSRQGHLEWILRDRYKSNEARNTAFIVSHPHGIAKRVTFGEVKEVDRSGGNYFYSHSYNVDTCPGSSGAAVWCLGCVTLNYQLVQPHHCQGGGLNGLNIGLW